MAAGLGLLLLATFTNPDQAAHLKAIKDTASARKSVYEAAHIAVSDSVMYKNYLVFSTTSLSGVIPLTYGYLGRVQTTQNVTLAAN